MEGVHRFLSRVYRFVMRNAHFARDKQNTQSATAALSAEARVIQRKLHQTIKRVTDDFQGRWHFNTSIAAIMEFVNELYAVEEKIARGNFPAALVADVQRRVVLLLAPFAPYLAAELWETLGEKDNLLRHPWPDYDAALAKEEEIEYPIQINGKLRSKMTVPADSAKEFVQERALADEKVRAALVGHELVKVIVVMGKLVNVVVK